jgi:hypothetical protein
MRLNRGLFNWGIFLIALGGVPLLVQLDRLEPGVVGDVWRLWPLILVGIGLGLVLRLTPLEFLGGALVAATFGIMFGSLLAGGFGGFGGFSGACIGGGERETSSRSGLASSTGFDLQLELTCGEVTVARAPSARWVVEAAHAPDRPPIVEGSSSGLSIRPTSDAEGVLGVLDQARNEWSVTVPSLGALSVGATLNAGTGRLTLGPGALSSVGMTLNASDSRVDLRDATSEGTMSLGMTYNASSGTLLLPLATNVSGGITLNAASLTLCASPDTAMRVQTSGTLSSDDLGGADLERVGDAWQTAGYADAMQAIDLRISSTVSSVSVDRSGTCD